MRSRTLLLVALLVGVCLPIASVPSATAHTATTCSSWKIVKHAKIGNSDQGELLGVGASSSKNAWAVGWGYHTTIDGTSEEHWNGTGWSLQGTYTDSSHITKLRGVAVLSSTNTWAVGDNSVDTIIFHRTATSWSKVASPSPGTNDNNLYGVAAASGSNLWAVGSQNSGSGDQGLLLHRNSSSWSEVTSPDPFSSNELLAVTRVPGTGQFWAVGRGYVSGNVTEIFRYASGNWSNVPAPSPSAQAELHGVAATSASNAWAVGYQQYGSHPLQHRTLIEHWTGAGWSTVTSPNPGTYDDKLLGIAAVSKTNIWAVGEAQATSTSHQVTLVLHYNGTHWVRFNSQNISPTMEGDELVSVARVPGTTHLWAVGSDIYNPNPLIEKSC